MSVVVGKLVKLRKHYASAVLWSRWDAYRFTSDDRSGTINNGDVALVIELYEEQAKDDMGFIAAGVLKVRRKGGDASGAKDDMCFIAAGVKVYFNNTVGWLPLDWIEEAV